tara:strand:+ start:2845 stop:3180 length:336 start_codon:yes stop_codon:yes gene_type:complete
MKKYLLTVLLILPFTAAQAGLLGLDSQIKGEYNLDTDTSTLTSQIGKTIGMYGLSVTGDVDFDVMEFAYDGVDIKAEYDVLQLNNASVYVSSGLDTNWEMEDIKIGLEINF